MKAAECWQSTCGNVTLYRGDAWSLTAGIHADACITDPPYGINYHHSGNAEKSGKKWRVNRRKIIGDNRPFTPSAFLRFPFVALFGAEHFTSELPRGYLLAWDKTGGGRGPKDSFIDCEFVWLNRRTPRNHVSHLWKGLIQEKHEEEPRPNQKRLHTSQKPVRVLLHIMEAAKLPAGAVIFDPFMGSGSTAIAALKKGCRFIGIEKSKVHFATAQSRIASFLNTKGAVA